MEKPNSVPSEPHKPLRDLVAKWREYAGKPMERNEKLSPRGQLAGVALTYGAQAVYEKCAEDLETALEAAARLPSVGQAPPSTAHNELSLVRLVLSAHQTAYARFHNGEGRGVIEADQMAIGYASVELAKALAQKEQQ